MLNQTEIFQRVSSVIADVFDIEKEEINPTSNLQKDFGAEPIDFLDIVFRLEREFSIKIQRNKLFPDFTCQDTQFEKDPHLANISNLFTVEMICKHIDYKLQGK